MQWYSQIIIQTHRANVGTEEQTKHSSALNLRTCRETTTELEYVLTCLFSRPDFDLTCCWRSAMSELSLARSCLMTWVSSCISLLGSLNRVRRLVTASKGRQRKPVKCTCYHAKLNIHVLYNIITKMFTVEGAEWTRQGLAQACELRAQPRGWHLRRTNWSFPVVFPRSSYLLG